MPHTLCGECLMQMPLLLRCCAEMYQDMPKLLTTGCPWGEKGCLSYLHNGWSSMSVEIYGHCRPSIGWAALSAAFYLAVVLFDGIVCRIELPMVLVNLEPFGLCWLNFFASGD